MKAYAPEHIRNVALVSHQGAGKTTLAEAILFKTGAIGRMGSVDEGTSNLDYHQSEIEHKTSIFSAIGSCEHENTKFNLVDTPGFEDFRGEAIAASASGAPPALFTSTSRRPRRSVVKATTAAICSTSRTSANVNRA